VNNKVDNNMLQSSISVEAQSADANSLLNVYKTWSRLRNTYPALAEGTMTAAPGNGGTIAAWYMTAGSQKLLVIHNTANAAKDVKVQDDTSRAVALLGTATLDHDKLTLGANSSVVFKL
jgi:glycosidase